MMDDDDGHTKFQFAHNNTNQQNAILNIHTEIKIYIIINLILTDNEEKKQYPQM